VKLFSLRIPTYVLTIPQRHRQTDRQTDGQTTPRSTYRAIQIDVNVPQERILPHLKFYAHKCFTGQAIAKGSRELVYEQRGYVKSFKYKK